MSNAEYLAAKSSEVWTEFDVSTRSLPPEYLGQPKVNYYNVEDWSAGLCAKSEIGKPKPSSLPPLEVPKPKTYAEKLQALSESAVDAVLDHPQGAKAWFKENPTAHVKVLVKLATPHVQDQNVNLSVEVSWLSKDRLSYKGNGKVQEDHNVVDLSPVIEDAKILEALSPSPDGPWKPVEDRTALELDAEIGNLTRTIPKPL